MLEVLLVLNDGGDGVTVPAEGEAVVLHVVVRKTLDEVQPKHLWHATQNKQKTLFISVPL